MLGQEAAKYALETDEYRKQTILDEVLEKIHSDTKKRNQELLEFVKDFVTSEEFLGYQKTKESICKCEKSTQYSLEDLQNVVIELEYLGKGIEKFPLTHETRKLFALKEQLEKYAERKKNCESFKRQQAGLNSIKEKIIEAKKIFECTKELRKRKNEDKDQAILTKYSKKLNLNLTDLSGKSQKIILDRLKHNELTFKTKKKLHRQNLVNILEKILSEKTAEQREQNIIKKRQKYMKNMRKEKIIEGLEVIGKKIELIDRSIFIKEAKTEDILEIEAMSSEKEEIHLEIKKLKKNIKRRDKRLKTSKGKKKEKHKKPKEKKKENIQENYTETIQKEESLSQDLEQMVDVIEEFRHFDDTLEDEYLKWQKEKEYDDDNFIKFYPSVILFQNCQNGKTYRKLVKIRNISPYIRKCRFEKLIFENQYDEIAFRIEYFGVQKLYTGCFFTFFVSFNPWDDLQTCEGKLRFVTYCPKACHVYQFDIPLKCVVKCNNIQISTEVVKFGSLPQWRVGKDNTFKIIKIANTGFYSCNIYTHKIPDPLNLDAVLHQETNSHSSSSSKSNFQNTDSAKSLNSVKQDIEEIIECCLQNLDNYFLFEPSFFVIEPKTDVKVKVFFKNADYVGEYFEKYAVEVYENLEKCQENVFSCKEVSVFAETTGHFLQVVPEVLDFQECVPDSCYQQSFKVHNRSNQTQTISIKYPRSFAEIIKTDVTHFVLPAKSQRVVWLKFIPRKYILNSSNDFFDELNNILEFPVGLHVVSRNNETYPPVNLTIYAIMTNPNDLAISITSQAFISNFLDSIIFDMGVCSTCETITSEIFLVNNSHVPQICGFHDIPECLKILPNQGFIRLKPNERKKMELFLSPDIRDFTGFNHGNPQTRDEYIFAFAVDSVYNIGKLKPELNGKALKNSMHAILHAISNSAGDTELYEKIKSCISALKKVPSQSLLNATSVKSDLNEIKKEEPCFRPSDVNINLSTCSELNYGNFIILETTTRKELKLLLVAKPNIPNEIIEQKARDIKYKDLVEKKMDELKSLMNKKDKKVGKGKRTRSKEKKTKDKMKHKKEDKQKETNNTTNSKKSKRSKERKKTKELLEKTAEQYNLNQDIIIKEEDLDLNYLDLYPAEMDYWRNMEAYHVKTNFVCYINYEKSKELRRRKEKIYLDAICKVVKPDFITNLNLQRVDFGKCVIGVDNVKKIYLQNIKYKNITLAFTTLNPLGPFSIPYFKDLTVSPEHTLEIPLRFSPKKEALTTEYFEIKSKATVLPLILEGKGVPPILQVIPEFTIYRLEVRGKQLEEIQITLANHSEASVSVFIKKVFEIDGIMEKNKMIKENETQHKERNDTEFNDKLTDLEKRNIEKFLQKTEEKSYFELSFKEDCLYMEPNQTISFKILFGTPQILEKQRVNNEKKRAKNKKYQSNMKKTKINSTKSSEGSKKSGRKKKIENPKTQHIVQYNIYVGTTFIKNIILIGTL